MAELNRRAGYATVRERIIQIESLAECVVSVTMSLLLTSVTVYTLYPNVYRYKYFIVTEIFWIYIPYT